jgi:hypothetical protein
MPIDMTTLKPVESSNIKQLGYDEASSTFLVKWNDGRVSAYGNVPPEVAQQVQTAGSPGRAVRSILGVNFPHNYVQGA